MRIGIDLGGTKIEGVVMAPSGEIVARLRHPTPAGDYRGTIDTIRVVVEALETETRLAGRCSIGIGMPGALSRRSGLVKNANSTVLNGKPFDRDVEAALGRPARFANDANCLALSEAIDGAAREARVVFAVIVGTGVGGGLVVDRQVVEGLNGIAGEWGHNPLPWPASGEAVGRPCYCGKTGCIETWISGPAFGADFAATSGLDLDGRQIVAEAERGATCAQAAIEALAERLGRSLALIVNIVDPDIIVIGGGLSSIGAIYELSPKALTKHAFSDGVSTPIVKAKHGDSSGVRGAAWLWPPD